MCPHTCATVYHDMSPFITFEPLCTQIWGNRHGSLWWWGWVHMCYILCKYIHLTWICANFNSADDMCVHTNDEYMMYGIDAVPQFTCAMSHITQHTFPRMPHIYTLVQCSFIVNYTKTTSKLNETTTKLHQIYTETTSSIQQNYIETTMELHWNYTETIMKLQWNYNETTSKLHHEMHQTCALTPYKHIVFTCNWQGCNTNYFKTTSKLHWNYIETIMKLQWNYIELQRNYIETT